jgi:hypothetical protein
MTSAKKTTRTTKKSSTPVTPVAKTWQQQIAKRLMAPFYALSRRTKNLMLRRPHRSFRRTRRRDYVRSLKLPGYWSFTNQVRHQLWQNKKLFILLGITYSFVSVIFVGLGSQGTYSQLVSTLHASSGDIFSGNWGQIGQASLLLATAVSGDLNAQLTDAQKIYATLATLMTWLTTIWLLRALLAGRHPRLRDGMYASGAPLISTFLISLLLLIQLLPVAIAAIGFAAASPAGILDNGLIAVLFWAVVLLLTVLSLYWITSTLIALVVITLPGMYPLNAIKTAGDLVIGRRVRVLLRLSWLALLIVVAWVAIMIPTIIFDSWIKGVFSSIKWLPIVPVTLLALTSATLIWSSTYIYMFYRKVVDDDVSPA